MAENQKFLDFEKPIAKIYEKIAELKKVSADGKIDLTEEIKVMAGKAAELKKQIFASLSPLQIVQIARHPQRPSTLDYFNEIFTDFLELHGDRLFGDDPAIIGGLARFKGHHVMVLGHQKGKNTKENLYRNFGMANPEGYRKALRLMKMAEKFNAPIIIFIDTPGAYPGIGGEERGIAEAIARNMREMSLITVPIICLVTGEGGSGGAIGIGVGNKILILQYAYYSVITPEACSAILFRDTSKTEEAAANLRLTAKDLKKLGVVDEIIPEPFGGAHNDLSLTAKNISLALEKNLAEMLKFSAEELLKERFEHFRKFGQFNEKNGKIAAKPAKKDEPASDSKNKTSP